MENDTPNLDFRYDECENLVHAAKGSHKTVGVAVAQWLEQRLRLSAVAEKRKTYEQAMGSSCKPPQPLCPGCYTLILIEALLELARSQKQSVRERCLYMAREFARLAEEARTTDNVQPKEGDTL